MTLERASASQLSRRGLMAAAGASAATVLTARASRSTATDLSKHRTPIKGQRILIKGGCIISMDAEVGDIAKGDVLIEGTRISAVKSEILADDALVIDASDMIVIPGFVDAHRHAWEGQLRRIGPDISDFGGYMAATHMSFAKYYRPEDMFVGNLITALGCIDAGITCIVDNSHNSRSADHSDMAIHGLMDAGIRAVHASGAPVAGEWQNQWPQDLKRLKARFFSSEDQLLTLGLFGFPVPEQWALARQLGLRIYGELLGSEMGKGIDELAKANLVGPDNTFNHCSDLPESTWLSLKRAGAAVNVCPRSDSQYALGDGLSGFQAALDHDMKPGFSIDNETSYGGDMFTEMRVAFHMQRALAIHGKHSVPLKSPPTPVSVREILTCATLNGAACAGLSGKVGRLAPGMQADLVLIRTDGLDLYPSNNALGTVVGAADRSNVDTVLIGGVLRKRSGKMLNVDMPSIRRMVSESRAYLFGKTNFKPDLFSSRENIK